MLQGGQDYGDRKYRKSFCSIQRWISDVALYWTIPQLKKYFSIRDVEGSWVLSPTVICSRPLISQPLTPHVFGNTWSCIYKNSEVYCSALHTGSWPFAQRWKNQLVPSWAESLNAVIFFFCKLILWCHTTGSNRLVISWQLKKWHRRLVAHCFNTAGLCPISGHDV